MLRMFFFSKKSMQKMLSAQPKLRIVLRQVSASILNHLFRTVRGDFGLYDNLCFEFTYVKSNRTTG
ncbi:hypothetical protein Solca_0918 [Solitalea canadensis DSM 3403]|uniref:Uncharacterized protein n=1 Tax=Solitalea canadensis (strain ATCC 29591 / DSM 3403 / JCM 21819 / LMG 8368 / NBRC 15130 / NCIMB 12057 / USAM 9D) TaxID=929556 RepID=H8KV33_SOLCM|nr:hypothetical protein Solca_0918 [Solitalea canadensis DSM 3403]